MAEPTLSTNDTAANAADPFDTFEIENAQCDLDVALTFLHAADELVHSVRRWTGDDGLAPNPPVNGEIGHLETLLEEMRCRIQTAAKRVDKTVDALVTAKRARRQ